MEAAKTITNTNAQTPAAMHAVPEMKNGDLQIKEDSGLLNSLPPTLFLQKKLTIGSPDDVYEKEADAMADRVMRMEMPAPVDFSIAKNNVQRKCEHCEDEEKLQRKPLGAFIQKKESGGNEVAASSIVNQIQSTSGGGSALSGSTKSFMENRFGADFSNVQIHTGEYAVQMSNELNAQAFTVGNDIYFNSGKYSPESYDGQHLLAHELTHTVQQNGWIGTKLIQRFTIAPTSPAAVGKVLSTTQTNSAIKWNQAAFTDADEIALLREVLEISAAPAVIDDDFIRALVQYQAFFGLSQDGLLGPGTALKLANELKAKATPLGAAADVGSSTEIAINPAERRTRLRSTVISRLGNLLHQGFVGNRDNPVGVVTVRSGFNDPNVAVPGPGDTNTIGINYTGSNVANSHWLQFTFSQMSAIDPATTRRVYRGGAVTTTGGAYNYSDATTFNWNVDTVRASGTMYYEGGGGNERDGSHTEIFDQPAGWNTEADAFAATFATRPASVRLIKGFDTYLVVNNNSVVYHARWNLYFNFNTTATPTPDIAGTYEVLTAGTASKLPPDRKAVLNAQFAGNTVP